MSYLFINLQTMLETMDIFIDYFYCYYTTWNEDILLADSFHNSWVKKPRGLHEISVCRGSPQGEIGRRRFVLRCIYLFICLLFIYLFIYCFFVYFNFTYLYGAVRWVMHQLGQRMGKEGMGRKFGWGVAISM